MRQHTEGVIQVLGYVIQVHRYYVDHIFLFSLSFQIYLDHVDHMVINGLFSRGGVCEKCDPGVIQV